MSNYYQQERKEVLPLVPNEYTKVLEIGCGAGGFKNNLGQACEYWGIEPVHEVAEIAMQNLDTVLVGTYDEVYDSLPNHYFDLIICNDVIEHMPDHDIFLHSIQAKMTENGCIVASIPNVRYLENIINLLVKKDWQYGDGGILDKTHLRFFTEKSLKKTMAQNGFIIEHFIYLNSIFTNPYTFGAIIKRVLTYIFGKDTEFLQFGIRVRPYKQVETNR